MTSNLPKIKKDLPVRWVGSLLLMVLALAAVYGILILGGKKDGSNSDRGKLNETPHAANEAQNSLRKGFRESHRDNAASSGESESIRTQNPSTKENPQLAEASKAQSPLEQAISLIDSGNASEAEKILLEIIKNDPNNEKALVELAMLYLIDFQDKVQAASYFERVIKNNPDHSLAMTELVNLYQENANVKDGLQFLESVYGQRSESSELAAGIGTLLATDGRHAEAIGYFERSLEKSDRPEEIYGEIANAYSFMGDSEAAINAYKKSISLYEKQVADTQKEGTSDLLAEENLLFMQSELARELLRSGQVEQAEEVIKKIEQNTNPEDHNLPLHAIKDTISRKKGG